ncbi:MAG: pyridoxal-phosphate dependent enzyme [Hyphomicrobiaceae bacterium]
MFYKNVSDFILDDVFFHMDDFISGSHVYVKLEGYNATGSNKLKTAIGLIDDLEARGKLKRGCRIIESSSGNLGIALSLVCAERGYDFTCVSDPSATVDDLSLIEAYGGEVVVVNQRDENGEFWGTRIDYVRRRLEEDPSLVWTNQYANSAGADVHRLTAKAVLDAIPDLDYLFVGIGTGGTVMGCQAYLDEIDSRVELVGVDVEGAVTYGRPPGQCHLPESSSSVRPELFAPTRIHEVTVTDAESIRMSRELVARHQLLAGGTTCSVLAGVRKLVPSLHPRSKIVAISPDFGERYITSADDNHRVEEGLPEFVSGRRDRQPKVVQLETQGRSQGPQVTSLSGASA